MSNEKQIKSTVNLVIDMVISEISKSNKKFGEVRDYKFVPDQMHIDDLRNYTLMIPSEENAKNIVERHLKDGNLTWAQILIEEVCESVQAKTTEEMANELIQVAAVAVNAAAHLLAEVNVKPNYSHLVGKWVKIIPNTRVHEYTFGKWVKCAGIDQRDNTLIMENDRLGFEYFEVGRGSGWIEPQDVFDLSNPLDHNPDEVRVFDVPSDIRISSYSKGLNLHFSEYQSLWYDKENNCYGVLTYGDDYTPIPCIATECKFEELQEGDLVFETSKDVPDFTDLALYSFVNKDKKGIWIRKSETRISDFKSKQYFKITPKP